MVSPEPPDDTRQVLGEHALLLGSAGQGKQLPGVILGTVGGGGSASHRSTPPPYLAEEGKPPGWGPGLGIPRFPRARFAETFREAGGGREEDIPLGRGRQSQSADCPWL